MEKHQYENVPQLNAALAQWISNDIQNTLQTANRYSIALSGGSTPKALYELLAADYKDTINWSKVHIFFDDERYVPFNDERNNARMAYQALLNKVPVPRQQVHIMQTNLPANQSAIAYEAILHQYFANQPHTFNLVLLGMGDDGHTLSLFPGTSVVNETQKWVSAVLLDEASGNYRITLTAPVVNKAAKVVFLVSGAGKAATLSQVLQGPYQPHKYPSQLIKPESNQLYWFIDADAAAELNN